MKSEQFTFGSESSADGSKPPGHYAGKGLFRKRLLYVAGFAILLIFLIWYFSIRYFNVNGRGSIVDSRLTVRAPADITLIGFHVREGEMLQKGDSLFTYHHSGGASDTSSVQINQTQRAENRDVLLDIQDAIATKRQERTALRNRLGHYRKRRQLVEKQIKLNATTLDRLQKIEDEIMNINSNIENINRELQLAYQRRKRLELKINSTRADAADENLENPFRLYKSTVKGSVTTIFKEAGQAVPGSEEILAMRRDSAEFMAIAVFSRKDAHRLNVDEELQLKFTNGQTSCGVIIDLFTTTGDSHPVLNAADLETGNKVVAILKPADAEASLQWSSLTDAEFTASKAFF